VTVCFDRGGWSAAQFADMMEAGFGLLAYRKGQVADPSTPVAKCDVRRGAGPTRLQFLDPQNGKHIVIPSQVSRRPAGSLADLDAGDISGGWMSVDKLWLNHTARALPDPGSAQRRITRQ
jgi:hypothetical protein